MARSIYVQVPAYLDAELEPTVRNLHRTAAHPERLRTVVLWQHDDPPPDLGDLPGVEVVAVAVQDSGGPNWARRRLRERWDGEAFTLLLDSHHRFVAGWDEMLVAMHGAVDHPGSRAVLTSYLPPYVPGQLTESLPWAPLRLLPCRWEHGVLARIAGWPMPFASTRTSPERAHLASFHFVFAPGELNVLPELAALDDVYFFGDELMLALVLTTIGWRMFHPHRMVGWHAYERTTRTTHWDRTEVWSERHERSLAYVRKSILAAGTPSSAVSRHAVNEIEAAIMAPLLREAA